MTSIELVTELNSSLEIAAQERNDYLHGLRQLAKQFKAEKKDLLKMLKIETSKAKRKMLKSDLRKVELAFQTIQ